MKKLDITLRNCHGIRELETIVDFNGRRAVSIYAPNGTMKTSFARTFLDLSKANGSADNVFPDRAAERKIVDEQGREVASGNVVVILSYDEDLGPTEATSTLLVNPALRKEYETLQRDLLAARDELASALKTQAATRQDVLTSVSATFTKQSDAFFLALTRIEEEMGAQTDAPFAGVPYDVIFNGKVLPLLKTDDFKSALTEYVTRLNQLLDDSRFFSRESFNYYNAATVTKSLGDNGFFAANHKLLLEGTDGDPVEIADAVELERLVSDEKQRYGRRHSREEALGDREGAKQKCRDKGVLALHLGPRRDPARAREHRPVRRKGVEELHQDPRNPVQQRNHVLPQR